jgi:hypothetical protein
LTAGEIISIRQFISGLATGSNMKTVQDHTPWVTPVTSSTHGCP